ncbi:FHA domain-containing protein [bacterium]|nr:FHA domain-containing protein [bacterium]
MSFSSEEETAVSREHQEAPRAHAVRTFMFALSTESGPRLLAFRISNLLIGRLPDNHLALNHGSVSRRHARVSVRPTGVMIEDMGSQNGTTVNGVPLTQAENIRPGDVLRIGHVPLFYFGFVSPDDPPEMELIDNAISVNPSLPPL